MSTNDLMGRRRFTLEGQAHGLPSALALIAVVALVAGCGVSVPTTGTAPASATSAARATSSAATKAGAGPTPVTTQTPSGPAGMLPCPISGQSPGHPALILTPTTHNRTGTAQVGDMVQVRLPPTSKWTYEQQGSGPLTPIQPSGVLIRAVNACVWSFQATGPGAEALRFDGQAICRGEQPCPLYRIALAFSVSVS